MNYLPNVASLSRQNITNIEIKSLIDSINTSDTEICLTFLGNIRDIINGASNNSKLRVDVDILDNEAIGENIEVIQDILRKLGYRVYKYTVQRYQTSILIISWE